jgi:autotransporter-associated beta strand protein
MILPGGTNASNNDLPAGAKINALTFRPEVNTTYVVQGNSIVLGGLVQNTSLLPQEIALNMELTDEGAIFDAAACDIIVTGSISGDGGIRKTGPGLLVLMNPQEYAGFTTIDEGALVLMGAADISSSSLIDNDATFRIVGGNHAAGDIVGGGVTEVLSGTLSVRSIAQGSLIIGLGTAATVPEPHVFILLTMAASVILPVVWRKK